jgi:hypothetical protein
VLGVACLAAVAQGNPKAEVPVIFVFSKKKLALQKVHTIAAGMILKSPMFSECTEVDREEHLPRRGTDNAATLILSLDCVEFEIHELCDVADEWKYFTHSIVD